MPQIRLFLSAVSAEFRSYRDAMRRDLERPNLTVKVQEDFIATGSETLDKLDEYISRCDAVIHLVGDMTGALAQAPSLQLIRARYPDLAQRLPPLKPCLEPDGPALSYTQWEAWLALYHGKTLIVAVPEASAPRAERHPFQAEQQTQQQQHLARLASVERYPEISFANADRLTVEILRSKLHDLLARAGVLHKPANLPAASLGELFKGRNAALEQLSRCLGPVPDSTNQAVRARVLSGLGGVGKTRLALEYAWRQADNYAASLFLGADSPEVLQRNLAALCRPGLLNLPEQTDTEEARQRAAVLAWLRQHPGWLLIIDNADTETAAEAVEDLLPQLNGGDLLITSRLSNWSGSLTVMQLDTLARADAADFLLARTAHKRRKRDDDSAQAETLADELGGLALALEQAGAYIAQRRLSLTSYLNEWRGRREQVLAWYDPRLMQYPCSVAVTWLTSFAQLGAPARHLLERLAWLSPAPIPESLLEVPIPDVESESDPFTALAELEAYSLISRDQDYPTFSVHRLVQDVTRRQQDDLKDIRLNEALLWLNAAFIGNPQDVQDWPILNPLMPHAQTVADQADAAGITEPSASLMNRMGAMYLTKCLYAEAEPLMRRALAIDEASLGAEHPGVARQLGNLAQLLHDTNRFSEAEPLMRRALFINESTYGNVHPEVAMSISNLARLLNYTNRNAEAEPLFRQALMIMEASVGAENPNSTVILNNLAKLLTDTNRFAEAEPLMRRALAIDEATLGATHPTIATRLNNLAQILHDTNRLSEAEPLLRRALSILEFNFGPEHRNVAVTLNNLALLLRDTNRLTEAEELMRRSLTINEAIFGAEHSVVAHALNNLALILQDSNRLAEAELIFKRALSIAESNLGDKYPDVALYLNNLALLLSAANRIAEAESMFRRALSIDETIFEAEHPNIARDLNNLARLLQASDRLSEAEELMQRALSIDEVSFGVEHPTVARDLNNLAQLLKATNRQAEAEPIMRRSLKIVIKSMGGKHPKSELVFNNYIHLLTGLAKTETEIKQILAGLFDWKGT